MGKKVTMFTLGMAVFVLSFGLVFAGCSDGDGGDLHFIPPDDGEGEQTSVINHSWTSDGNSFNLTVTVQASPSASVAARSVNGSGAYILFFIESSGTTSISTGNAVINGANYSFTPSKGSAFSLTITQSGESITVSSAGSVSITFDDAEAPKSVTVSGSGTTSTTAGNTGGSTDPASLFYDTTWQNSHRMVSEGEDTTYTETIDMYGWNNSYVQYITLTKTGTTALEKTIYEDPVRVVKGWYYIVGNILILIPTGVLVEYVNNSTTWKWDEGDQQINDVVRTKYAITGTTLNFLIFDDELNKEVVWNNYGKTTHAFWDRFPYWSEYN
uniref:Lipoprotein n=1 Tax=uncultured bacterium contig00094 TaxID=1181565 RepID=A0A806K1S4_9BACT|nr:hypothetical protein [uncultured bacterium contig00094]